MDSRGACEQEGARGSRGDGCARGGIETAVKAGPQQGPGRRRRVPTLFGPHKPGLSALCHSPFSYPPCRRSVRNRELITVVRDWAEVEAALAELAPSLAAAAPEGGHAASNNS